LPIASFAAHRLGHYRDREDDAIARFEGVCSACYVDVLVRAGELMYADLLYPGADLTKTFAFLVDGMAAKLSGVESIPAPGAWIGGASPVVADFFAAEAFECRQCSAHPYLRESRALERPGPELRGSSARTAPSSCSSYVQQELVRLEVEHRA
jgi:hypothetical protein